ncbi:MAG: hypothetical protein AB7V01_09960 [Vicinamibacterales bacterium]
MRSTTVPVPALLALLLLIALPAAARAQGQPESPPASPPEASSAAARRAATEARFAAGFARLQFLRGRWTGPAAQGASRAAAVPLEFRPVLGGKYLEAEGMMLQVEARLTVSYDTVEDRYRMTILDAGSGVLDVYAGTFDAAGALVLTNPHFFRVSLIPHEDGTWTWRGEHSPDEGRTWGVNATYHMTRVPAGARDR